MASAGLLVSLPQMVDLAIGSPETGSVNFNLLNAALQVIIHQLQLHEYTVDFRDPDVERMQSLLATAKPGMSLKISEAEDVESVTIPKGRTQSEEIKVTEQRRNSKEPPNAGSIRTGKHIVVEPSQSSKVSSMPHVVVGVSQELFTQIHEDVEDLKNKVNEIFEIPNNETIMEAVRAQGQDKLTPVIDMWQALTIAKRLDAAETGMEKLASMFENLIQQVSSGEDGANVFEEIGHRIDAIEDKLAELEVAGVGAGVAVSEDVGAGPVGPVVEARRPSADDRDAEVISEIMIELENLQSRLKTVETDVTNLTKGTKGKSLGELFRDVEDLKNKNVAKVDEGERDDESPVVDSAVMTEIQEKLDEINTKLNNVDETLSSQIDHLQEQLLNIEKELGALHEAVSTQTNNVPDVTTMGDLFNKILKLQDDFDGLGKLIDRINEEQEERSLNMDALTEQVELLKTTKADREDLEDALADKADIQHVNRKVSTMQFDSACEDLTKHIEETMQKLTEQEEMWQATLEELQVSIGTKLDRQEFDPLREFVNRKIKSLQLRLKALLAMKENQEAAGTKSKILKNVNCISCDKDVVMYKENKFPTFPAPSTLPGNRSIKPYITYELDAVRKQQKSLPQGRNMNHLETALHEDKPKKEKPTDKTIPAGHLCNRYCGGSHTMTQPQQRVAHLGHFLNQWGPQAIPLDEGTIMGTDGQMYKARDASGDAPKPTDEEKRRLSGKMQTEDTSLDKIPRMSSTLEPIRRTSRPSKAKTSSIIKQVKLEEELEPVKEEAEDASVEPKPKTASRLSIRKSGRKSSSAMVKPSEDRRKSSSKVLVSPSGGTSSRSLKKSQISLKRLSMSAPKETTPPREEGAEPEAEEKPAEPSEEPLAPEPEAPPEGAPEEAPPENPEEPPAE